MRAAILFCLQVKVDEVMQLVRSILDTQQAAMARYPFDA
jgi:hypothetical protein